MPTIMNKPYSSCVSVHECVCKCLYVCVCVCLRECVCKCLLECARVLFKKGLNFQTSDFETNSPSPRYFSPCLHGSQSPPPHPLSLSIRQQICLTFLSCALLLVWLRASAHGAFYRKGNKKEEEN